MPRNPESAPQPERRQRTIPEWAQRERHDDLIWITENLHIFWPAAQACYEDMGPGIMLVDTTSRPTGEGHPIFYLPESLAFSLQNEDLARMLREYDPTVEFVIALLKHQGRESYYRYQIPYNSHSSDSQL